MVDIQIDLSHIGQFLSIPHYMHGAGCALHGARDIQKLPNVMSEDRNVRRYLLVIS